jgi:hypothetical protein
MSHERVLATLKRRKAGPEITKAYDKVQPNYDTDGFIWKFKGRTLLYLPEWKYDTEHLDTLVHETNHLIHYMLVKRKQMEDEVEAQAYQQAYLFSSILTRLNSKFGGRK